MRRPLRFLLRNWPLKLAAVLLATLLYSGLVVSQNVRTFTGNVPVDPLRPPPGAALLTDLDPVREIRYRAPLDVGILSPEDFRATADLSRVEPRPGGEAQDVPVRLDAVNRLVQIVDFTPRTVQVRLDSVVERELPITVDHGPVPAGINVGTPQTEPRVVTIRGASSAVAAVRAVVARVTIDASALNIDRDVELVPLDDQGNEVPRLELDPSRARVRIPVAVELATRPLPVVAQLVGELAGGYAISDITVEPLVVTVSGSESVVTHLEAAETEPIDIAGRSDDFETTVGFSLPEQVSVVGSSQVRVALTINELPGSRTFMAGLRLVGTRSDLAYRLASNQVSVTLAGSSPDLNGVSADDLLAVIDVTGLAPGDHEVTATLTPPAGLDVLAISPERVAVRIEAPAEETPAEQTPEAVRSVQSAARL